MFKRPHCNLLRRAQVGASEAAKFRRSKIVAWLAVLWMGSACLLSWNLLSWNVVAAADETDDKQQTVKLIVDFDDGVEKHFTRLPWKDGMTVLSATEAASKHRRGIRFKQRGRGATAFLYEIDGLATQSGGRGWLYRVNGKRADRSFGISKLKAGDTILWEFANY